MKTPDGHKIILIEDDPDITDVIVLILEAQGHTIEQHTTGRHLVHSTFDLPDLFIVDGNLSDINGIEICRRLKDDPATNAIPIIFISASKSLIQKVKQSGLAIVIEKPFGKEHLVNTVAAAVR